MEHLDRDLADAISSVSTARAGADDGLRPYRIARAVHEHFELDAAPLRHVLEITVAVELVDEDFSEAENETQVSVAVSTGRDFLTGALLQGVALPARGELHKVVVPFLPSHSYSFVFLTRHGLAKRALEHYMDQVRDDVNAKLVRWVGDSSIYKSAVLDYTLTSAGDFLGL